jgi:hypothetical protein
MPPEHGSVSDISVSSLSFRPSERSEREPESITTNHDYGFRVSPLSRLARNDTSKDVQKKPGSTAKGQCRAICIAPALVGGFWPYVAPLIEAAMRRGGITDFTLVERAVFTGTALLWIACDARRINAAAITELGAVGGERFCTIVACAGADRAQWLPLIAELEDYARREGCKAMRIFGRRGWSRVLPDYKTTRILLEKALD